MRYQLTSINSIKNVPYTHICIYIYIICMCICIMPFPDCPPTLSPRTPSSAASLAWWRHRSHSLECHHPWPNGDRHRCVMWVIVWYCIDTQLDSIFYQALILYIYNMSHIYLCIYIYMCVWLYMYIIYIHMYGYSNAMQTQRFVRI